MSYELQGLFLKNIELKRHKELYAVPARSSRIWAPMTWNCEERKLKPKRALQCIILWCEKTKKLKPSSYLFEGFRFLTCVTCSRDRHGRSHGWINNMPSLPDRRSQRRPHGVCDVLVSCLLPICSGALSPTCGLCCETWLKIASIPLEYFLRSEGDCMYVCVRSTGNGLWVGFCERSSVVGYLWKQASVFLLALETLVAVAIQRAVAMKSLIVLCVCDYHCHIICHIIALLFLTAGHEAHRSAICAQEAT